MKKVVYFLVTLMLVLGIFTSTYAASSIFTGTGNWYSASNWSGGLVPHLTKDTVIIQGNCTYDFQMGVEFVNNCTIIVERGGTFNLEPRNNLMSSFNNYGSLIVLGSFNNKGFVDNRGSINISGSFINIGYGQVSNTSPLFTVESGGTYKTVSSL